MGAAYDIFGNGKTSFKVNLGKYLQSANNQDRYVVSNPATRFQRTTARNWNDRGGLGTDNDYVPQCDLMNPAANGECGQWLSPPFGSPIVPVTIDPAILSGWGVRPWDWQFGASVQHEILPRTSVEFGYHRRWFGNFTVTDNRAVGPNDFDKFTIAAPQNALLPGGGGYNLTYLRPESLAVDNYVTLETNYADARTRYLARHGPQHQYADAQRPHVPRWHEQRPWRLGLLRDCRRSFPRCSATRSSRPGSSGPAVNRLLRHHRAMAHAVPRHRRRTPVPEDRRAGEYRHPVQTRNARHQRERVGNQRRLAGCEQPDIEHRSPASLGRLPTGTLATSTTTLNLLLPGQLYGDRVNQVDLRVAKVLRFGRTRSLIGVDMYNVFNANPGLCTTKRMRPTGRDRRRS